MHWKDDVQVISHFISLDRKGFVISHDDEAFPLFSARQKGKGRVSFSRAKKERKEERDTRSAMNKIIHLLREFESMFIIVC